MNANLERRLSLQDYQSAAGIEKWIAEIGGTSAPVPRENVRVALSFLATEMPSLSIADAVSFLAAMDLSKSVRRVILKPGERVIGFRTPMESPFKLFFARSGSSPHTLGINTESRGIVRFTVRTAASALESWTTGAVDAWTAPKPGQPLVVALRSKKWFGREFGVVVSGGAGQLIIPQSYSHLLLEER